MEDVIQVATTTETVKNPFASRNPRPALEDLLDLVNERDQIRFARLDNSLLEGGAFRELYYYGTSWGWAVRYRHGRQTLMTIHFLPARVEVTVALSERQAEMVARDRTWRADEDQLRRHLVNARRRAKNRRRRTEARFGLGRLGNLGFQKARFPRAFAFLSSSLQPLDS
jgi:hypothetical protein